MADISTTYGGGGITTQTSGLPGFGTPGGGQMPDFAGLMRYKMELERQKAIQEAQLRDLALQQGRRALQPPVIHNQIEESSNPGQEFQDQDAASRAQQAQLRILEASSRPMPTKFIQGGPGIIGGYAPDTTLLPQALLPKNAGFERGGLTESQYGQLSPEGQRALVKQRDQEDDERQYAQPTSIRNQQQAEAQRKQEDLARLQGQQRNNSYYGR